MSSFIVSILNRIVKDLTNAWVKCAITYSISKNILNDNENNHEMNEIFCFNVLKKLDDLET